MKSLVICKQVCKDCTLPATPKSLVAKTVITIVLCNLQAHFD